jgi:F0F1-type ATP synthase delta subunit
VERLKLSNLVISPADVSRLRRELVGLNDFFVDAQARQAGTAMRLPKLTRLLNELAKDNSVNLLEEADRNRLSEALGTIYEDAPTLHISFASEPSPKALEKLIIWIRGNIHPQALVQVGLQPSVAVGCFLRTPNKTFDMSLRASLKKSQPQLVKLIDGAINGR